MTDISDTTPDTTDETLDADVPDPEAPLDEPVVHAAIDDDVADEAAVVAAAAAPEAADAADADDDDAFDEAPSVATARAVLEHLIASLVDDPDAVSIHVGEGRSLPRLTVRVGPSDMGRVIGKRGRVAQAIRTVVRAAAVRDGTDVEVEFED